MRLVLLNKPFRVLSQFSDDAGRRTLRDYIDIKGCYPAGRLDYDSEGLLVLTDFGPWQARISQPGSGFLKRYLMQVEGAATDEALETLRRGVRLADGSARAVDARLVEERTGLWPREPPIRYRKSVPTSWIELTLNEGRNRQVRRMTAAVGLPALRLVRWSVGPWTVEGLKPGEWCTVERHEAERVLSASRPGLRSQRRPIRPNARKRRSASRVRAPARN